MDHNSRSVKGGLSVNSDVIKRELRRCSEKSARKAIFQLLLGDKMHKAMPLFGIREQN
jgi:hypothetical protein